MNEDYSLRWESRDAIGHIRPISATAGAFSNHFKPFQSNSNETKNIPLTLTIKSAELRCPILRIADNDTAKSLLKLSNYSHHLAAFSTNSHHFGVTFFLFFRATSRLKSYRDRGVTETQIVTPGNTQSRPVTPSHG